MSRQYFADTLSEPPVVNLTAIVATTETALWDPTLYSPIAGNDCRPGKIYRVIAGGIITTAATGTLTITPRFGLTTGGVTMGASGAQTVPASLTNVAWELSMTVVCRTTGAAGSATGTVIGTGTFSMAGTLATAGSGMNVNFGGTSAAVRTDIATGICLGWTLSVAGSVTPQFAFIQSYN